MFEKVEGFILKTQDYGETHKIVTILTPTLGKVGAIARGAKKTKSRMAAITQPFIHGSFLIQPGSSLATIQQGEVITSFRKIREDIFKTAYTSYLAELTDKLVDAKKYNPFIYKQLLHTIERINDDKDPEILTMIYEWKMYKEAGFAPVVTQCVSCGNSQDLKVFSISNGGLLCRNCVRLDENAISIPEKVAKLMALFAWVEVEQIGNISVKTENKMILQRIMDQYYEEHGGYYLKSKRFLKQMNQLNDKL
ncbi:DNA repair protein RecO [Gracilibacillus thailandensis]|uniref:DNA repair protein RecO n=1 Tax=Gracilibacillus thailandensis TaxID=563735 RepID=A0A6N7R4Y9_9BACI|nr:DNA repair protein RecO [Gracilibacillus thailandensis]MRI68289.1 DNA repair protein RecO [Gracilibacillus thailandensis]